MEQCSTVQAAKKCGIHPVTLQRWIAQGRVPAPAVQRIGGVAVRIWTARDLQRLRNYKNRMYRKGRGRKATRKP